MEANVAFNPNQRTLADCQAEIRKFQQRKGIKTDRIITSRMVNIWKEPDLSVKNVPGGFNKAILPIYFETGSTFYISSAGPGVTVPKHSHDEGPGLRFIVSGSIIFDGQELSEGDWMYLPAKAPYEFVVGPRGVTMCYCYCCCCA